MTAPWIVAFFALSAVVLVSTLIQVGLLRRASAVLEVAEARLRSNPLAGVLGGLPVHSTVRDFTVTNDQRIRMKSRTMLARGGVVLFLDWDCAPCQALMASVRGDGVEGIQVPIYAVVPEEERSKAWDLGEHVSVVFQTDQQVSELFENSATPQAFMLDREQTVIATAITNSAAELKSLANMTSLLDSTRSDAIG